MNNKKRNLLKSKITLAFVVLLLMASLTGCSSTCKVAGCDGEVYSNGLCSKHSLSESGDENNAKQEEFEELQQKLDDAKDQLNGN